MRDRTSFQHPTPSAASGIRAGPGSAARERLAGSPEDVPGGGMTVLEPDGHRPTPGISPLPAGARRFVVAPPSGVQMMCDSVASRGTLEGPLVCLQGRRPAAGRPARVAARPPRGSRCGGSLPGQTRAGRPPCQCRPDRPRPPAPWPASSDAWTLPITRASLREGARRATFWRPTGGHARRGLRAEIAQLVEHATENRGVGSSILPLGTISPIGGRPSGSGSVGRASPCQGEGRGFESRLPLHSLQARRSAPRPIPLALRLVVGQRTLDP